MNAPVYVASSPEALPFLKPDVCAELSRRVRLQRGAWVPRHPNAPSYTLGPASHLDAAGPGGLAEYEKACEVYNPQMNEAFVDFYIALCERLSAHLRAPVVMHDRFARPSFHILEAHPAFEKPSPSTSGLLQAQLLPWGVDAAKLPTLSFSMAVEMPASGAGLDVWAVDVADRKSVV